VQSLSLCKFSTPRNLYVRIVGRFHKEIIGTFEAGSRDQPPGHASQWTQARNILSPTTEGFEERLEAGGGDGRFVPSYIFSMRRVAA